MSVAIVTGASRGIGAAIADRLAVAGHTVVRLAPEWKVADATHMVSDLSAVESHAGLVSAIVAQHGPIKCLINNAGIGSPKRGPFTEMTPAIFDAVMAVNLRGTVFFTQAVLREMVASPSQHPRSIQFITSVSATHASPDRLDYCMSKAALSMFAKGLALDLAPRGIAVFEIRPGIIRTAMTAPVTAKYDQCIAEGLVPQGRWGEPADIAAIAVALVQGDFAFATGSVIDAGGGLAIAKL